MSDYVSRVTFEEYVRTKGRLGYNRFRMELYVGNPDYPYTYVLSLKYRQWFKISRMIWQDEPGSGVATVPGSYAGRFNILDLSIEVNTLQTIHLQTRPFSMGYHYSHIHRIVTMMRATLTETGNQKLITALYGSDDLQNWKLLAYAKRNPPVSFSQIRTTPSARSWRYYVVCTGGQILTEKDIDMGPLLVDYEPVIRRIG
jgi:hypothetical protein